MKALASGKDEDFARVYAGLELPVQNRCAWVRDAVDVIVSEPKPSGRVRAEGRPDAGRAPAVPHDRDEARADLLPRAAPRAQPVRAGPPLIPPGPFLDELKANGLVKCKLVFAQGAAARELLQSPPYHFCLQEQP